MADEDDKIEEDKNADSSPEDGAEGEDGEEGEAQSSSKKKLLLFILLPILLLGGVGGGLYFSGMLNGLLGVEEELVEGDEGYEEGEGAHGDEEKSHGKKKKGKDKKGKDKGGKKDKSAAKDGHGEGYGDGGAFVPLPPLMVNLKTADGSPRYLKLSVQLELEDPADKDGVKAILPRVIDQFQTYLRELRVKDLRGSAGIYRLQMELLLRVNQAADPIEIKDVLFQEILIQ